MRDLQLNAYKETYKKDPPQSGIPKEVLNDENYQRNLEKLKGEFLKDILASGTLEKIEAIAFCLVLET